MQSAGGISWVFMAVGLKGGENHALRPAATRLGSFPSSVELLPVEASRIEAEWALESSEVSGWVRICWMMEGYGEVVRVAEVGLLGLWRLALWPAMTCPWSGILTAEDNLVQLS